MGFVFETVYDIKTLTAMAKALRKTVRKKKSRRAHILGPIIIVVGLLLSFMPDENGVIIDGRAVITWIVVVIMLAALIWEDKINAFFAQKRLLKGTEFSRAIFNEDNYVTETEIGKTVWEYSKITDIVETKNYFVFVFSHNHAQAHRKSSVSESDLVSFREFLEDRTLKKIQSI